MNLKFRRVFRAEMFIQFCSGTKENLSGDDEKIERGKIVAEILNFEAKPDILLI